jgi:quinol monooxygenase YgiN
MLVLVVSIDTTAENIAAIKDAIGTMEQASRAEAGCHDYTFSVELNDPNRLRITECWEDEEALKAHFATPHMAAFNAAMAQAAPRSMDLKCYKATEVPFPINRG